MEEKISTLRAFSEPKTETLSSLRLQIALHFNVCFAPFWAISHIACLLTKYSYLSMTYKVILVAVHTVTILIEIVRLFLGYYGNLGEKIPALSGFWITTVILQLPIVIFLSVNEDIIPLPLERSVYIIHIVFLLVEIFSGFLVVRKIADHQMTKFKQRVLEEDDEIKQKHE
ncbi:Transmembrane protein 17B [Toxocara canis]|uniref:Transmembrane protein 17B n=1 Tax=Toxocara canis TaxID=6265 RepID=A0A0B2VRM9_TOXCA|nr:Transmembrane protein 17B [Toxocara canis]